MTPTEIIAAHKVMWSIDGNIQCRCKALMRHDDHPSHVAAALGLVQFWSVAYADGYQLEESYENWDQARDLLGETGEPDAKIITAWFTGWQDANTQN